MRGSNENQASGSFGGENETEEYFAQLRSAEFDWDDAAADSM